MKYFGKIYIKKRQVQVKKKSFLDHFSACRKVFDMRLCENKSYVNRFLYNQNFTFRLARIFMNSSKLLFLYFNLSFLM